jgi:hypothetical protein
VVREWSLLTIYKGMFEFMMLQVIAIAMVIIFPSIAVWLPQHLQEQARQVKTEEVEEGVSLEDYQTPGGYVEQLREALEEERQENQQEEEGGGDSLEKDELSNTKK